MRKKLCLILVAVWGMALLAGCSDEAQNAAPSSPQAEATHETDKKEQTTMKMNVQIGDQIFTATLADTKAAQEFAQMLPMTITLNDYSGFEKVGSLGRRRGGILRLAAAPGQQDHTPYSHQDQAQFFPHGAVPPLMDELYHKTI